MSQYFPEPKSLGKVKVELQLFNCAQKTGLKSITGIDTSSLVCLKSNGDKLDINKLKNIPANLSNL